MCRLSVNINKVAWLRNARGGNNPDILLATKDIQRLGAQGITVHPRPDERHIRYSDAKALRKVVDTEYNIEGYPSERWMDLVLELRPEQATLVPDPPHVLTSNAGWNLPEKTDFLIPIIKCLKDSGIRTSIFMEPDPVMIAAAAETGADRIELYTEAYARAYRKNPEEAISPYRHAAETAGACGLGINAGHDLDLHNLTYFYRNIRNLQEVSIGHALICDALYLGYEKCIQAYLTCLR